MNKPPEGQFDIRSEVAKTGANYEAILKWRGAPDNIFLGQQQYAYGIIYQVAAAIEPEELPTLKDLFRTILSETKDMPREQMLLAALEILKKNRPR